MNRTITNPFESKSSIYLFILIAILIVLIIIKLVKSRKIKSSSANKKKWKKKKHLTGDIYVDLGIDELSGGIRYNPNAGIITKEDLLKRKKPNTNNFESIRNQYISAFGEEYWSSRKYIEYILKDENCFQSDIYYKILFNYKNCYNIIEKITTTQMGALSFYQTIDIFMHQPKEKRKAFPYMLLNNWMDEYTYRNRHPELKIKNREEPFYIKDLLNNSIRIKRDDRLLEKEWKKFYRKIGTKNWTQSQFLDFFSDEFQIMQFEKWREEAENYWVWQRVFRDEGITQT